MTNADTLKGERPIEPGLTAVRSIESVPQDVPGRELGEERRGDQEWRRMPPGRPPTSADSTSSSSWELPPELPGYTRTVHGDVVTFRREIAGPVLAHVLLQLAFLALAPLLLFSEDRMVVALVSNPLGIAMMAAGCLHVMDYWLRLSTAHRPIKRSMTIARTSTSKKQARLTIDGKLIDDEQLMDVMILFPTSFGEPLFSFNGEDIRQLPRARSVRAPGIPVRATITTSFRLTVVTTDCAYDVVSLQDAESALWLTRGLKRSLGFSMDLPVQTRGVMPFSAGTRMIRPMLWFILDLAGLVAADLLMTESWFPLRHAAGLILLTLVLHNLCMLGLGLTQRADAKETGEAVNIVLGHTRPISLTRVDESVDVRFDAEVGHEQRAIPGTRSSRTLGTSPAQRRAKNDG